MKGLILVILLFPLSGCVTRRQVQAAIWLNNAPLPADLCRDVPELSRYGFYRRLNDGRLEFVSWCKEEAGQWFAIHKDDLERLLNQGIPEKRVPELAR